MNSLCLELLKHKSFLKLTREHPEEISEGFRHQFQNNNNPLVITLKDTGVLEIVPENHSIDEQSLDIIISSGIHGNETAPIELCDQLVAEILKGSLQVNNRILFIIGNPVAMNSTSRFEIENLNRLFCGKHKESTHFEAKRAAKLESYTTDFYNERDVERCHFDLHTAIRASKYEKFAIVPFQHDGQKNKKYLNFFLESQINTVLFAHQPSPTFSYYTSRMFGANAFTVELGRVRPFGENDLDSFSPLMNNLRLLITGKYESEDVIDNHYFNFFRVVDEVKKISEENFALNIAPDIANFTEFPIGFQLTTDDNAGYKFKAKKQAIVFPNAKVPVGHRIALIVAKTTV